LLHAELIQVRWRHHPAAQTFRHRNKPITQLEDLESIMNAVTSRQALFLAAALAVLSLAGCADVHQDPASNTVVGQADASTQQSTDAQPASATNIPF
jgi:hypothetical protein